MHPFEYSRTAQQDLTSSMVRRRRHQRAMVEYTRRPCGLWPHYGSDIIKIYSIKALFFLYNFGSWILTAGSVEAVDDTMMPDLAI